jgi:uncharacterized membrane protein
VSSGISPDRLVYVDALRGLAILLMVQDHAFDWWLRGEFHPTPWGRVTEFLGTLAAPLFLLLMGISLALSREKRLRRGMPAVQTAIGQVRRGLFLIVQGYVVTVLTFYNGQNAAEMWAVDVLHCLGLSMIVLLPFTSLGAWPVTLLATVAVASVSPWAGNWDLEPWLGAWINGTGGISYFPLLPFLTYTLLGLVIGQVLARGGHSHRATRHLMLALVAAGGGLFLLVPFVPPDLGDRFPKPVFMVFSLTIIFWLTTLFYALSRWSRLLRPLARAGQAAMMLYVVHHLLGYRLFSHLGWVTGHSWEGQYGIFGPGAASLLLLVLLASLYGLTELWLMWRPRIGPAALVRRFTPAVSAYW